MNEGVDDRCWNEGVEDLGAIDGLNEGVDDRDENDGVEDRGGLRPGVLKLGVLERLDRDGMLNDRFELDGALNERLGLEGALNERLERDGMLKDGDDREPKDGDDRELNEGARDPPNDPPPDERGDAPPGERDTDALRAQTELGIARAKTAVASPRVRTTKWCDNINRPRCRIRRRQSRLRGKFFQTVKYYAIYAIKARRISRQ